MVLKSKILLFIIVLFVSCGKEDIEPIEIEEFINPEFVAELKPVDDAGKDVDISERVIQGLAPFENGWFVTQTYSESILLINYLDESGISLLNRRLNINSHGQDLSIEQVSDNELFLYTTMGSFNENRNTGIIRIRIQFEDEIYDSIDWQYAVISLDREYMLDYSNCTPTLSEDKKNFAIRSKNTILVHSKQNIYNDDYMFNYHFEINNSQLEDNKYQSMWFQGIAMKQDTVYCLTGNERLDTYKKIYAYDRNGIVTKKYIISKDSLNEVIDIKFEPEGLAFVKNELYLTIMTKNSNSDNNIKYLYKFK